jgi:uncharacterized SAM-binding protein YcdF (DUF218 family)
VRFVVIGGTILLGLVGTATAKLFFLPATDTVERVDAIVLFVGGRGERLALAERLMNDGYASNLVVPNGLASEWPEGNRACSETRPYRVFCPRPEPDTTRGEARAIASLAQAEGWRRVIAVTSTYQVSRAGLLLARCFDGAVLTVKASPRLGVVGWVRRVGHEWPAWSRAVLVDRNC